MDCVRKPYAAIATDHLQRSEASRPEAGYWSCADNTDPTIYRGRLDDPHVPVYIEGTPGQTTDGVRVIRGKLYVTGDLSGPIRVYDMATKTLVGKFETDRAACSLTSPSPIPAISGSLTVSVPCSGISPR